MNYTQLEQAHALLWSTRMRRSELEKQLEALGWRNTGRGSGSRHVLWAHPHRPGLIAVPQQDLLLDAVALASSREQEGRIQ